MAKRSNPNGANQYLLDPRQKLCWDYYANPNSKTFGNAKQSALKAGYELVYANTITDTTWFLDKVRRLNMLSKAEKVLDEMLEMDTTNIVIVNDEQLVKKDPALAKIKQDTAKFVSSRLGKEDWSERQELTGKNGEAIKVSTVPDDEFKKIVAAYAAKPREENTSA